MMHSGIDWYSPGLSAINTGGMSMAAKPSAEDKKMWLGRYRATSRERAALKAGSLPYSARRLSELEALREEIKLAIENLENNAQRTVLMLRYVECREWHEIAESTNYCERQVYRYHTAGVQALRVPQLRQRKRCQ